MGEITSLINAAHQGNSESGDQLYGLVYGQLRAIAQRKMAMEGSKVTLQPTALVNEVFVAFAAGNEVLWRDRQHFFRTAARAMQRILIDGARRRNSAKRGGGAIRSTLSPSVAQTNPVDSDLLDLADALEELESVAPEHSELVRLHFFSGLTIAECAGVLEVSLSTAERKWRFARAWLKERMSS